MTTHLASVLNFAMPSRRPASVPPGLLGGPSATEGLRARVYAQIRRRAWLQRSRGPTNDRVAASTFRGSRV